MLPSPDDGPSKVTGTEPQRPEEFAARLERVVRAAVRRMRTLVAEGGADGLGLRSAAAQRSHLFAELAGEGAPAEGHGKTRRPAWSLACCRDPARRGQFAESYVGMLRAAWRLDDGPSVAVLVGQCRRCGRLHWAEAESHDDDGED